MDEILDDSDAETPMPLRLKRKDEEIPEMLILSDKKAGNLMDDELMASDEDEEDMQVDGFTQKFTTNQVKNPLKINKLSL